MSKKLYLLAVGVNEFLNPDVSDLNGCENDVKNIYEYLESSSKNTAFEFIGKKLLSKDATKTNVVKHFKEHLGQAKTGDVAIFYFSGHGAEEKADEVFFKFQSRETLTTVVCHDSRTGDVTDLADKEIRYLVHKITGGEEIPHFVLIMDSCHSGGTTRSMDEAIKPRLTGETDLRDWSQFIFADEISHDAVANAVSLRDVMPEGNHVHLSSCEDGELAYEVSSGGVFTSHLLDILKRSSGKVTYSDINGRIRLMLRGRFPQQPTIYSPKGGIENELFLGGAIESEGLKGNVVYNTDKYRWELDLGSVHGLTDDISDPTIIHILDYDGNIIAKATPDTCTPSISHLKIEIEDINKVNKRETYIGQALNVHRPFISFHFTGEEEGVKKLNEHFLSEESQASLKRRNIKIVDNEVDANYVVRGIQGQYFVTLPFDKRPLALQLFYDGKNTFDTLDGVYFHTITEWEYLSNIYNNKSRLRPKPPVKINIYKVIDEDKPENDILLEEIDGELFIDNGDSIRISMTNHTRNKKLYVNLYYMAMDFGVYPLNERNGYLQPEETYWVYEREGLDFEYEDYIEPFNFEYAHFELKVMCSTEPITNFYKPDGKDICLKPLEHPIYPLVPKDQKKRPVNRRKRPDSADWATHSVRIVIKNDNYKPEKS